MVVVHKFDCNFKGKLFEQNIMNSFKGFLSFKNHSFQIKTNVIQNRFQNIHFRMPTGAYLIKLYNHFYNNIVLES